MKKAILVILFFSINTLAATRAENLAWIDQVAATGNAAQFKIIMISMWKANMALMDDATLDARISTLKTTAASAGVELPQ